MFQRNFEQKPNFIPSGLYLASCQALSGRETNAMTTVDKIRQNRPDYDFSRDFRSHFKNPQDHQRFTRGLKAGGFS